jgi:16S rRNA (cytosine967-C5)-methyltransferase
VAYQALIARTTQTQKRLQELFVSDAVYARDRALAMELVMGCLRNESLIERIVEHGLRSPRSRLSREMMTLLKLGVLQLIWLDGTPGYAAVNSTVDLAKEVAGKGAASLVNGLLRNVQRSIVGRSSIECRTQPSRRRVLLDQERVCELNFDVLCDPGSDPVAYWASATSTDIWLVRRWRDAGLPYERICMAGIRKPAICLRPNLLKTDAEGLAARLVQEGCKATVSDDGLGVYLHSGRSVTRTSAFREGYCQPQDLTAIRTVDQWLAPRADERVLDLCAVPGAKTTAIAERMKNTGRVVAVDIKDQELDKIQTNCNRLGITNVETVARSKFGTAGSCLESFDRVLVDAPCTNTGVLARRPEAKRSGRTTDVRLAALHSRQVALLVEAFNAVKIGGIVVYSTCSLEQEENENVVRAATSTADKQVTLVDARLMLPCSSAADWRDGGFAARFRRIR